MAMTPQKDKKTSFQTKKVLPSILKNTSVRDLLPSTRTLVLIDSKATLDSALMKLHDNAISSAPLFDLEQMAYLGVVTMLDIACYITKQYPTCDSWPEKITEDSILKVIEISQTDILRPVDEETNLQDLSALFSGQFHRLPVSCNGNLTNMISQTDLVRFFVRPAILDALGPLAEQSLLGLGLVRGADRVVKVDKETRVIEALTPLCENKLHGVAVTDSDGSLMTTFDLSALRSLSTYDFFRIEHTINQFMKLEQQGSGSFRNLNKQFIAVGVEDHFGPVVSQIAQYGSHIAWVVDKENKPIGVVTLNDIITTIRNAAALTAELHPDFADDLDSPALQRKGSLP